MPERDDPRHSLDEEDWREVVAFRHKAGGHVVLTEQAAKLAAGRMSVALVALRGMHVVERKHGRRPF